MTTALVENKRSFQKHLHLKNSTKKEEGWTRSETGIEYNTTGGLLRRWARERDRETKTF